MNENVTDSNSEYDKTLPYKLAISFLQSDITKVLFAVLLCSTPRLLSAIIKEVDIPSFWILLLTRILELSCIFYLATPHIQNFRTSKQKSRTLTSLLLFGLAYWLIVRSPILALTSLPQTSIAATVAAILIVPSVAFGLIFFFYFFPICAGVCEVKLIMNEARWITKKDPYAPFKAFTAPVAIYFLISNMLGSISPDGREYFIMISDCILSEIPLFLLLYTSLGFCFSLIEGKKWHDYGFSAYREARFETLVKSASTFSKNLSPNRGLLILLIAALIGYANLIRVYQIPPSPSIKIESNEISDNKISLALNLSDKEYRFRGFQAHAFKIAGPKGTTIHKQVPVIDFKPNDDFTEAELKIEFKIDMKKEEIERIEDLNLWYFNSKLLELKKADPK